MPRRHSKMDDVAPSEPLPTFSVEALVKRIGVSALRELEQRILNGVASSQELCTAVKFTSREHELEILKLESEVKLKEAQCKAIEAAANNSEFQARVLRAIARSKGATEEEVLDDGTYLPNADYTTNDN